MLIGLEAPSGFQTDTEVGLRKAELCSPESALGPRAKNFFRPPLAISSKSQGNLRT